jgi:DNA ligase-1
MNVEDILSKTSHNNNTEKPAIMLLKTFNKSKIKYPCLAAIKKDGIRARFVNGHLYTRQGHKIIGCEHIENDLKGFKYELDGELYIDGMHFDKLSGLLRNYEKCPEAKYYIFDIPNYPGVKLERTRFLHGFASSSNIEIVKHYKIKDYESLKRFYSMAINSGEEGIVIYDLYSLYEDKRSYDWMRMVPLKTADCNVIGFYEGKGKFVNSLGGLIVDYNGCSVKVGTGFKEKYDSSSDTEHILKVRDYIWNNKQTFINQIAEVEFKGDTKAGSMRQPRFKRWRWDK